MKDIAKKSAGSQQAGRRGQGGTERNGKELCFAPSRAVRLAPLAQDRSRERFCTGFAVLTTLPETGHFLTIDYFLLSTLF